MKMLAGFFLMLLLLPLQALSQEAPQSAADKLKAEGFEIGLKLPQSKETVAEEANKLLTVTPFKKIPSPAPAYRASCNQNYCAFALRDGSILIYEPKSSSVILNKNFSKNPIYSLAFHSSSNLLAFGDKESRVHLFDIDRQTEVHTIYELGKAVSDVKFSPDGKILAVSYLNRGDIGLYDAETYKPLHTIKAHGAGIYYLAFSPDSRILAAGSRDRKVSITPLEKEWPDQILGEHKFFVLAVDFSPDGRFLASGGADAQLIVWQKNQDTVEAKPYFTWIHGDWINSVKFFKGYLITGSKDGKIRVFDCSRKVLVADFKAGNVVFGVDVTPDGKYLAVASEEVSLYNLNDILKN